MARIGTVIREVYHRPGTDALPAHLEDHYGIRVTGTARLTEGVFRVDHDAGPPWVARIMLASRPVSRTENDAAILRFLERHEFPAERCAHPGPVTELDGRAVLVTGYLPGKHPAGAGTGPRLASLAGLLHSAGPRYAPEALAGYREHVELTAGELGRLEGVLWIRVLWLSAWQCWLACVSAKVAQGFFPRRDYITALAAAVRAHSGRPA